MVCSRTFSLIILNSSNSTIVSGHRNGKIVITRAIFDDGEMKISLKNLNDIDGPILEKNINTDQRNLGAIVAYLNPGENSKLEGKLKLVGHTFNYQGEKINYTKHIEIYKRSRSARVP